MLGLQTQEKTDVEGVEVVVTSAQLMTLAG